MNTRISNNSFCTIWGTNCFVLLLMVLGGCLVAHAQQITGTISGTVKDEQGALVTTASIKATNLETGFSRSAMTDSDGVYRIQYLPVGNYTVEVVAPTFKMFVQQNVVLTVDQTQTLSVVLTIGALSETVTVSTAPPLINTNTAELGRTVDPEEIIGLPLVNRNVYAELSLTPGVQSNSASPTSNPNGTPNFQNGVPGTQVVVNGGIDDGVPMVSFYLDGGINAAGTRNYGNPMPNPDAIQEFRVETSNFSAQYGRMSGAVVTAVTKSGTNQLHGSLFESNRNTDLNATNWNVASKAPYHRNQFGGTVGGPVVHDKAFFFFSYGGLRQTVGQALTGGIMPTALERQGDFSKSKIIPNMPGTKTPVAGTNSSINCMVATVGCIPSALLDPTAANILTKYVPMSNSAGNTWSGYFTGPTNQDEYLGKFDENLTSRDHIAVSYFHLNTTQNAFGGGSVPYDVTQSFAHQQNLNLSDIHTISPATANQTWFTFARVIGGRVNLPAVSLGDLGSSYTIQGPHALPSLSISGNFSLSSGTSGPLTGSDFYAVRDIVSTTKGKHSLDMGAELSLEKAMQVSNLFNFGSFSFSTSGPTTTGNTMADFVTGQVASMEQDTPFHVLLSDWYYALFLQDNYRIAPHLTLTLGLRYDLETPPVESQNLTQTFVPGIQSTVVPTAPQGVLFPGDKGVTRGVVDTRKHHISPRAGIVWDPLGDGKTAIRAGAGIFYGSVSGIEWDQPANAQPYAVRQTFNSITSLTNIYGNPASFPNGDPFPYTFTPSSPRFLPAAGIEAIAENYQWPLVYQINAAVERQLPGRVSVTAAYVSTLSHDLPYAPDANAPVWASGASTGQASINARRPYDPGVLGQVQYISSSQTASYHSFQISAHRPLTHNLLLSGFYVYSKSFWSASLSGLGQTAQDFYALREERGPADNDLRSMASISGIWNLDYYRGSNFLLKQVVNGWSISPVVTMNSGAPVNIVTGSDKNADGYSNDRPNLVAGVNPFLDPHRSRSVARYAWFNTAAFTANGPGLGIGPGGADGTTPRDYLRAPGFRDIDLGLFRDFSFEHGIKLQVRGEATNAFNLVSLNAPTANVSSAQDGFITGAASPRLIQVGLRLTF